MPLILAFCIVQLGSFFVFVGSNGLVAIGIDILSCLLVMVMYQVMRLLASDLITIHNNIISDNPGIAKRL